VFSFYANKTITTGEGGMATTHKKELAERMRIMSLHGISRMHGRDFLHLEVGIMKLLHQGSNTI